MNKKKATYFGADGSRPIAIDSVVTYTDFSDTPGTKNISITPPSGGDVITVVALAIRENNTTDRQVDTMTFDGDSFTEEVTSNTGGIQVQSSIWYLVNPTATTANLQITMNDNVEGMYVVVVNIVGVNVVSPIDASTANNGTSNPAGGSLTTNFDNSILVDGIVVDDDDGITMSAESGRVERLNATSPGDSDGGGSTRTTTTAGSYDMEWTKNAFEQAAWSCVAIRPAA